MSFLKWYLRATTVTMIYIKGYHPPLTSQWITDAQRTASWLIALLLNGDVYVGMQSLVGAQLQTNEHTILAKLIILASNDCESLTLHECSFSLCDSYFLLQWRVLGVLYFDLVISSLRLDWLYVNAYCGKGEQLHKALYYVDHVYTIR